MNFNKVFQSRVTKLPALYCLMAVLFISQPNAETVIQLDTNSPGAIINKNIYGQFMEHLGRGIYEGVWVGEGSKIENVNGFRTDVLTALQELEVPLVRWPGGCFADEYHWRDGIGPRDQRTVTVNTNWGGVTDNNAFGTHELFDFAELLGAEVYINGNLGTGTSKEMAQWIEYMICDSQSTHANLRRKNGRDKPWKVDYFAIGNEAWGCGGSMTPEYYTNLYKHYASFLKTPGDNQPVMIASGGHTEQLEWTEHLIKNVESSWAMRMQAISHHYYTLPTGNWDKKGSALNFDEKEWFSTLKNTLRMEGFIKNNLAILDEHDPDKKVGFYVDEWGTWYDAAEGDDPGFLYQQNTLRDAMVAALNLNLFHQYAERIHMTNIAQMVNVLQAMILTDKEKMLLTPTYHIFKMYVPFQDAVSIPVSILGGEQYQFGDEKLSKISASAGIGKDGKLYLALANVDANNAESLTIKAEQSLHTAVGQILTGNKLDTHNTFENPHVIQPASISVNAKNGDLSFMLAPKSIVVFSIE
ncbi:alpha-L-arabinofuranosidase C-terminal domain-containing protein [uncultured Paraglaciecola sp.]|uniref:alpha-N-arabinofuranosidase n=1 Tax=uncultured Paraglaciecola sp. TaxID=1765024 RepID=UPI0025D5F930|nr:alpha-L-arabinofuranosidase C-terminal domain-containing protein [uncultured Paraglaciecola sp.]